MTNLPVSLISQLKAVDCVELFRLLKEQRLKAAGEEMTGGLIFESFPQLALVRTYCADHTVADSACSATAYLGGVKGNKDTVGVRAGVEHEDCQAGLEEDQEVSSLLSWAQQEGKLTGLVTTDRLTGASPAGTFAHTASRDWESDQALHCTALCA